MALRSFPIRSAEPEIWADKEKENKRQKEKDKRQKEKDKRQKEKGKRQKEEGKRQKGEERWNKRRSIPWFGTGMNAALGRILMDSHIKLGKKGIENRRQKGKDKRE